ncbi:hypothetical protein EIP91_005387 [Steccherinum ochraceum]|uniref:Protein kinase domain-containing protein n=1 Tax=Steccherinum ochraceum TaxID=92696 RepID=A0A4R0R9Q9_9APHY|nr:hypothetical protein EIP91_005387 [Steccherinum ochraceum]
MAKLYVYSKKRLPDFVSFRKVLYLCVIRGREGEMFIRPGKLLDELMADSLKYDTDKHLLLASRGDLAGYVLERLQAVLDGKVDAISVENGNRYGLRRLLVRLCLDTSILPPSLFLTGIKCEDADPVGMGGYADIFRGTYGAGKVAMKRLRVFLSGTSPQSYVAFFREALVWRHLRHPHILQFLGIDRISFRSQLCMILPWMQYGDINHAMNVLEDSDQTIPYLRWTTEIAQGMAYLHIEHVVHADLRGGNVLIDDNLSVRLSTLDYLRLMSSKVYSQSRPFPSMNDAQVIVQLMRGERPPRRNMKSGEAIPDDIWRIVENSWSSEVKLRPGMNEIAASLIELSQPPKNDTDAEMADESELMSAVPMSVTMGGAPDPEVVSLIESAASSKLYQSLVLSSRGDLADRIACTMQELLDRYSHESYNARPRHFQFTRYLLLKLSSKARILPSSLLVSGVQDTTIAESTGISDIYTATYEGQKVALKRLRNSQSAHERSLFEALCRETLIWRQLKHPYILPFLGTCNIQLNFEPRLCLVSPWAKHGNVVSYFWRMNEEMEDQEKVKLLEQWVMDIAQALEYLHKERIVHADVRGGNILIDCDMHAKLAHFNVSFFADELRYEDVATEKQYGSEYVRWMAPELLGGDTQPTFSTDVYAFGCLCVEMFIGEEIYISLDWKIISRVLAEAERPSRPSGIADSVAMSDELWALVQKCWAEPNARLTMSDVTLELEKMRSSNRAGDSSVQVGPVR